MEQKVIILRALPWGRDSRVERWAHIYHQKALFGVWGESKKTSNILSITNIKRVPKKKNLIAIGYLWFCIKCFYFVFKYAKKGDTIVFIDLETILLGFFAAKMKRVLIHYDIADPFFLSKPIPFRMFWKKVEKIYIKLSDLVTAPLEIRFKIFFDQMLPNMKIVENVPLLVEDLVPSRENVQKIKNQITIGYFGGLEKQIRGLEYLVSIAEKNSNIVLKIAGDGELADFFLQKSHTFSNIIFLGKFEHKALKKLAYDIDLYFAYYDDSKELHKVACPNKYYEHLYLEKPIIISSIVPQSKDVEIDSTGWIINNLENDLIPCIEYCLTNKDVVEKYASNCRKIWKAKYANYYQMLSNEFNNILKIEKK